MHPTAEAVLSTLGEAINSKMTQIQRGVELIGRDIGAKIGAALLELHRDGGSHVVGSPLQAGHLFASIGLGAMRPQFIFDMSLKSDEVASVLANIPVYIVVNKPGDDFVLVSGEHDNRQLGLFFLSELEAEHLVHTIKKETPDFGRKVKVMATTMDKVYDYLRVAKEKERDVLFRFVPDETSVEAALDLFKTAGLPSNGFPGVPVFQAEGLTVKGDDDKPFTPLFLSKKDLDIALGTAFASREQDAKKAAVVQAEKLRSDLDKAQKALAGADGKYKRATEMQVDKISEELDEVELKLHELEMNKTLHKIDVGSLEEVIAQMELDSKGIWQDVMFVPSNSLVTTKKSGGKK